MKKLSSKHRAKGFAPKVEPDPRPSNQQIAQSFEQAVAFHQANNLEKALEIYQYILSHRPHNVDTMINVANIYKTQGKIAEAIAIYRRALESKPDSADAWYNLGNTLQVQGEVEEAMQCYRKSLKLRPNFGIAYFNLGRILQDRGNLVEAEGAYKKALKTLKKFPPVYTSLGNIAKSLGKIDEAVSYHQQSVKIDSRYAEGYYNLANIFREGKAYEAAIKSYLLSLKMRADFPEAWFGLSIAYQLSNNLLGAEGALNLALNYNPKFTDAYLSLAVLKQSQGKYSDAETVLNRGLKEQPNNYKLLNLLGLLYKLQRKADLAEQVVRDLLQHYPEDGVTYCNLGTLYNDLGNYEEAIAYLEKSIALATEKSSGYLELAHNNLAYGLVQLQRLSQAIDHCQKALEINPKNILAHLNLGWAFHAQGKIEEAIESFEKIIEIAPDYHGGYSNRLHSLNYDPRQSAETIADAHFTWGKRCQFEALIPKKHAQNPKIRIGYLAPYFNHSVVADLLEPILLNHNQDEFEIFCYSNLFLRDNVKNNLAQLPYHWRDVYHSNDQQGAELINSDELDILVDLAGHLPHNRLPLLARKPAPIQISYLGYPSTTGLEAIDYYLTDGFADPIGLTESYYREELLRLPHSFLTFQPPENSPPVTDLPARENKKITFGSCNPAPSFTPKAIALWSGILKSLPDSRIVLKSPSFTDRPTCDRYLTIFAHCGIDSRRVQLLDSKSDRRENWEFYSTIDIALDPFPYNGTISTCEAMWMGVPVITLAGNTHASRTGVSLLTTVGLTEFIAQDIKEYLRKALALAQNLDRLSQLRANLRQQMTSSPLCDVVAHTQAIEAVYRNVILRSVAPFSGTGSGNLPT